MRYVNIDLSSDNYLQEPQIFGGYAGEHNETILQVKLPNRMVDIECSGYRFDFQTSEDNKISSPLIPVSELHDYTLSFKLAEQLTVAGKLLFNVVAISSDENSDKNLVSLISKTNRAILLIEDSTEGNPLLIDPNGYKDELQKMVDERVSQIGIAKGEKGDKGDKGERGISGVYIGSGDMPDGYNVQIDPNGSAYELPVIDQTYNPESENAQSGKAVAEAVKSSTDWITLADITLDETNGEVTSIAHKGIDGQILQKCKELMMIVEMDAVNEYKSSQMYLRVSLYRHYQMPIMYATSSAITANTKVRTLSRVFIGDMGALALSSKLSSHELFNSMTTECNTMVAFGSNEYDSSPSLYINLVFSSSATATQNFGAGAHFKLIGRVS